MIHPIWFICLFVRFSMIFLIRYFYKKNKFLQKIIMGILLTMGLGFVYKALYGSNSEYQISEVFWHDTRIIHGVFFILSVLLLQLNHLDMNSIILFLDIVFSIIYRINIWF